ncbi:MAG: NAD(P)-dependent oxidoreductase [Holophagales bacterium]|nr:NAD(P)-dependent oxidoreductase [Holophagales bacterium]
MTDCPRLVLTGAAGFVGRRLIDALTGCWRIEAIDREPPLRGPHAEREGVRWHAIDVADEESVTALFERLAADGGACALIHLAAHYDFTGDDHPDYHRTNVEGTRILLEASRRLGLERFVFASSVAACEFPCAGKALDESSPPDGSHRYAVSKRAGEEMVRAAEADFPTAIVRFAALFSDWCEYAPLYHFLETWLSGRWNARVLGGQGRSAVPYLHVRDACLFLQRVLERRGELGPAEVLIASPNGATSHAELYRAATSWSNGGHGARRPIRMPKPLATVGVWGLDALGRLRGARPFERPWMSAMIDKRLTVDASHTHRRLGWWPRERLSILRRMPFLLENRKAEPGSWLARNRARLHTEHLPGPLRLQRMLEEHEEEIFAGMTRILSGDSERWPHYAELSKTDHDWNHRMLVRALAQAVRVRERAVFRSYCRDLATRRARQGFTEEELRGALLTFERLCREAALGDPRGADLAPVVRDLVTVTVDFGLDAVDEAYEELGAAAPRSPTPNVVRV